MDQNTAVVIRIRGFGSIPHGTAKGANVVSTQATEVDIFRVERHGRTDECIARMWSAWPGIGGWPDVCVVDRIPLVHHPYDEAQIREIREKADVRIKAVR